MPALDALIGGGAIHIADQNKQTPIKTLCGQALDKESTRYFLKPEGFALATCKVCRGIYFDESWSGEDKSVETPVESQSGINQQESQSEEPAAADPPMVQRRTLFQNLTVPVNSHAPKQEQSNGA